MRRYTPEKIESLLKGEVFVFGSNASGFHGAGAAGLAWGVRSYWRNDTKFLEALRSPKHAVVRIGRWAVLGMARGYQEGNEGASYAIETIKRPGLKRSTSLSEISQQLIEFSEFSKSRPEFTFYVTKIGSSLAGYSVTEIAHIFSRVNKSHPFPDNVILPKEYECRL